MIQALKAGPKGRFGFFTPTYDAAALAEGLIVHELRVVTKEAFGNYRQVEFRVVLPAGISRCSYSSWPMTGNRYAARSFSVCPPSIDR